MIVNLVVLLILGTISYFGYTMFLADKLDSPRNSPAVKGLEKAEIKVAVKENEAKVKTLKEEIKDLEKERKDILAGSDADKADKAQEKLETKQEKVKELAETEANLTDLKVVEKGGYKSYLPNKFSWNNGLWIVGSLIVLSFLYKLAVGVFKSIFRNMGFEE